MAGMTPDLYQVRTRVDAICDRLYERDDFRVTILGGELIPSGSDYETDPRRRALFEELQEIRRRYPEHVEDIVMRRERTRTHFGFGGRMSPWTTQAASARRALAPTRRQWYAIIGVTLALLWGLIGLVTMGLSAMAHRQAPCVPADHAAP